MKKLIGFFLFFTVISCSSLNKRLSKKTEEDKFTVWFFQNYKINRISYKNGKGFDIKLLSQIPDSIATFTKKDTLDLQNMIFQLPKELDSSVARINVSQEMKSGFYRAFDMVTKPYYLKKQNKFLVYREHYCGDLCGYGVLLVYEKRENSYVLVFSKRQWVS